MQFHRSIAGGIALACVAQAALTNAVQSQTDALTDEAATAAAWIARDGAEQGDAGAQIEYGDRLYAGLGVPRNVAEALDWWSRAALQGHAEAMVRVGDCLARGDGAPKNPAQAAKLYERAASRNHAGAMVRLGTAYSKGAGVDRDPAAGEQWLKRAAALDHPEAQYLIGWKLEHEAADADAMRRAATLYRRAADKGFAPAMMSLGVCYAEGAGVEHSLEEAYAWSLLAVRMGEVRAEENVRALASALGPFKRFGARRRADALAESLGLP